MPNEGNFESERDQLHALWLDKFKSFAASSSARIYGPGTAKATIYTIDDVDYEYEDPIYNESEEQILLPMSSAGSFELPLPAAETFSYLHAGAFALIDLPVSIDGVKVRAMPYYTFSLSELMLTAHPRNMYTGIFKGTYAGRGMSYRDGDPIDAVEIIHLLGAGYGIMLVDKVRELMDPFATDQDLLKLTSSMYLSFDVAKGKI